MNFAKTAMLLAALTARFFSAVGDLLGGLHGMLIALGRPSRGPWG